MRACATWWTKFYPNTRRLVDAGPDGIKKALKWLDRLAPSGGTNSYTALKAGFERFPEVDTIYFLSDGKPSRGAITDPDRIAARVIEMNRRRRVRVHTIALLAQDPLASSLDTSGVTEQSARFMQNLAAACDGTFVRREN